MFRLLLVRTPSCVTFLLSVLLFFCLWNKQVSNKTLPLFSPRPLLPLRLSPSRPTPPPPPIFPMPVQMSAFTSSAIKGTAVAAGSTQTWLLLLIHAAVSHKRTQRHDKKRLLSLKGWKGSIEQTSTRRCCGFVLCIETRITSRQAVEEVFVQSEKVTPDHDDKLPHADCGVWQLLRLRCLIRVKSCIVGDIVRAHKGLLLLLHFTHTVKDFLGTYGSKSCMWCWLQGAGLLSVGRRIQRSSLAPAVRRHFGARCS